MVPVGHDVQLVVRQHMVIIACVFHAEHAFTLSPEQGRWHRDRTESMEPCRRDKREHLGEDRTLAIPVKKALEII
jgi:hypothetical protein